MKRQTVLGVVGCVCVAVLGTSCITTDSEGGNERTIFVGPAMKDGTGVGPMTCLLVKESPDAEYTLFYSSISGFDYIPGFEYELLVDVTERDPVPMDASKFVYTLKKVVSKKSAGLAIDRGAWELSEIVDVSGNMVGPVHMSQTFFQLSAGKVTGNAGANNFTGGYELKGTTITFSPAASNMMMGTPELMAQETQFMKWLGEAVAYRIVGNELRLLNGDHDVVVIMKPRIEPTLTSNEWKAVGVNNGKGGVASLVAGSKITLTFTEEGHVSGNSGCNDFSGGYTVDEKAIKIGPLAGTRKMGPEKVMEQEMAFLQALEKSRVWKIQSGSLELRNDEGSLQVKFMKKEN